MIPSALLLVGVIATARCDDMLSNAGPTSQPATRLATQPSVQVLYADYEHPLALSDGQINVILRAAEKNRPIGRSIWFVLVLANEPKIIHGPYFRSVVYYSPDELTPDLRRGQCLFLSLDFKPSLTEYVQVSPEAAPFGDVLTTPKLPDLPFSPPVNDHSGDPAELRADELARLVRFARRAEVAKEKSKDNVDDATKSHRSHEMTIDFSSQTAAARKEPIHTIRVSDNEYEVQTGWVSGMLGGAGHSLRIKRDRGGYRLVEASLWRA